jgi:carboxymethylenebutenolidase
MREARSQAKRTVILAAMAALGVVFLATAPALARAGAAQTRPAAGRDVEYKAGGETVKAYLALPPTGPARGGVVVVHEWWGLNEQIRGVADRLAASGYIAIVPDLYRGQVATEAEEAHELMRGLQEERASSILRAAGAYLRSTEEGAGHKVASLGFCMGGRLALVAALDGPQISGVVMFYGRPVLEKERLASLKTPVLGLFGAEDRGISPDDARAFESAVRETGNEIEVRIYDGAGHAFFNDTRSSYNEKAARDAWSRALAFLERNLTR